uniref:Disintegrin and metalloproteinase domain-containing protein 1a-like n=1 Tax=Sciurus vulgaris TaxID=55149 RepID=A0A8D2AW56_SCIVU
MSGSAATERHRPCVIIWALSVAASLRNSASILSSLQKNQVAFKDAKIKFLTSAPQKWNLRLGLAPGQSRIRLGTLMLLVIFLPSMYCYLGSVTHSFFEITVPQRLTVQESNKPVEETSYILFLQGQKQVIHLRVRRDYFVSNFPIYTYHSGILGQEMPPISHDCHYEGYIEGAPGSFVSVNTCSGLRGILIKEDTPYSIKPKLSSKQFEHVLFTTARRAPVSCGVPSQDRPASTSQQQGRRNPLQFQALSYLWSLTKYVEMFVVVNNERFQMWGSNVSETVQRVVDIIALANSFTRGINTEVVLAGMEIWTEGDLIEVPVDLQGTLRNFNSWRQENLSSRVRHDVAHLIVGHHPGEDKGQAFLSGACSSGFAAAVESFPHEDVLLFAALLVHQLGHNLGIRHDRAACVCKDKPFCLMRENITKASGFSNCSSEDFHRFLQEHKGTCLFNKPWYRSHKRRASRCGNGVVEEQEECDCGSDCDNHPCCDTVCKLKRQAQCSDEACCRNCVLRRPGSLCRPSQDECDLPEYCDGRSKNCPADSYKQDGTQCDRIFYCVGGRCKNPDIQCRNIYGHSARSAPEDCYLSTNRRPSRFANCGRPTSASAGYVKCKGEDIFCGKLVCTGFMLMPRIRPHHTLVQVPHGSDWCWVVDAYDVTDIPDDGDVQTGTYCAPDKVCRGHSCSSKEVLKYDCEPEELCNGKGVCNNLKHCHCEDSFAPPDCRSPGAGGSVDSGPPSKPHHIKETIKTNRSRKDRNDEISPKKLLLFIPLALFGLLCTLMLIAYLWSEIRAAMASSESSESLPRKDNLPRKPLQG